MSMTDKSKEMKRRACNKKLIPEALYKNKTIILKSRTQNLNEDWRGRTRTRFVKTILVSVSNIL